MKKTQKKILGLAGLLAVSAMTVVAVLMPGPGALAATSTSMTDTLTVRVVGEAGNITIKHPTNDQILVNPDQSIDYDFEHIETVTATLEYTDLDGNTHTIDLGTFTHTFSPEGRFGSNSIPINLADYGYGDFVVKLAGMGDDEVPVEKFVEFSFAPVTGEANQDPNTGDVVVDLDYDTDNEDIDHIQINVYDKDGNLIESLSPTNVPRPQTSVTLPFVGNEIPDGLYTIEIIAIDDAGEPLAPPYYTDVDYKTPVIPVPDAGGESAPNTGGFFVGLNISKTDYLVTGLIIFFIAGISGIVFVTKGRQGKKR